MKLCTVCRLARLARRVTFDVASEETGPSILSSVPTLTHYLVLSALVFVLGLFAVITRRNGVAILMGIELMLNAANINLVAFNKFVAPGAMQGQIFALIVITLAACEAAVGLALVLAAYRSLETIYLDEINLMKW